MARLVILGAGVSGQTAALHARRKLGKEHEVIVISPNSHYNWIPSNIWVGVGLMTKEQVLFPLAPVYEKTGVEYHKAKATAIYPEGNLSENRDKPYVLIESTDPNKIGQIEKIPYDYLINATGPSLNFAATKGLGPDHHNSLSVCTASHADETWKDLSKIIDEMKKGKSKKFLVGTGHGNCTCQGAAFEYILNLEFKLRQAGVREKAEISWISNEAELGDFGMGGMHIKRGGYVTHSKVFTESLFSERGIKWVTKSHVKEVLPGKISAENIEGQDFEMEYDFSMLLPPFKGQNIKAYNKNNEDISAKVFAPNNFMLVDALYNVKNYEDWKPSDWPKNYQSPLYKNIFAIGIAFAPPHAISKPTISVKGVPIFPTPPRTGMPSGVMGRIVAYNIVDMINGVSKTPTREASLANMGAACLASAGANFFKGTAVSMTMYPIIPDFERFPETGRDLFYTTGEIGLAGHWLKYILHYAFMYKAKANPFWPIVPE